MAEVQDERPTIALITGAWQHPDVYEPLRRALAKKGYESVCQSPPSTCLPHGDTDLNADIAFVHNTILKPLVDSGKEVITVMHSFGGVYGGGAVKGLSKTEVSSAGRRGGIIALVYVSTACIPTGTTLLKTLGVGDDLLPWVSLDKSTGLLTIPEPIPVFFNRLPTEEAKYWAGRVKHQALKPMQSIVPYAPFEDDYYKDHLAYLQCTNDETIHPPAQKKFFDVAGGQVTDELPTSHFPWLEMPDETAEKVLNLAQKVRM
ncbi:hypothetical protein QQS21_001466 [Conoideocrella luteorostrata]|uniref:AB hydrolase-1 domain-containing protein n=1 Tax=Conoideocrella luteorostrata TaxID=1105319 RepID=A0AAJ0CXV5_9HYPO|nr:hypothetical protein QQS21_001466 [Conoideocrella luteorostrata]